MFRQYSRPLTSLERAASIEAMQKRLAGSSVLPGPVAAGCAVVPAGCALVVGFGFGAGLGLVAALLTGHLPMAAWFALWFGGAAGALAALVMIGVILRDAGREARRRRDVGEDSFDVEALVTEGEASSGWWYEARAVGGTAAFVFPAASGQLAVLTGAYLDELRQRYRFPHHHFLIVRDRYGTVLSYQGSGGSATVRRHSSAALSEAEREALEELSDGSLVPGRLETFLRNLVRYRRAATDD